MLADFNGWPTAVGKPYQLKSLGLPLITLTPALKQRLHQKPPV